MDKKTKPDIADEEKTKILDLAKKRFKKSVAAFNDNYKKAIEILKFKHGIDQWTTAQQNKRKAAKRPALVINELPKFSNIVCGEMRRNKVQIKVAPADGKGSQANAMVRAGMIKNIEYMSNAEVIYDHAGKMLVDCGFAAARVLSRYANDPDDPFLEELYIQPLDNPFCAHPDPGASDSRFYSDGEYFFIDSFMPKDDFVEAYGEDLLPTEKGAEGEGTGDEHWYDDEKVVVREYFYKEYTVVRMAQLSDGQTMTKDEANKHISDITATLAQAKADQDRKRAEAIAAGQEFDEQPIDESEAPTIIKERVVEESHIKWLKITSTEILESNEWPGSYIPVAFATGEYTNIGGKKYYNGLFKDSEDPQRLTNNAYTSLWEVVASMPKAPWKASAKMIEGYENDYLASNAENFPVLKYRSDDKFPGKSPEQNPLGQMPVALFSILQECKQNIKDSVGMYNADVGDKGPEVSGKAILARQAPGDTSTYIYHDNRAGFVAQIGKILNEAIPYYYDSERDVRLRGFNGKDSTVPINTTAGKAAASMKQNPQRYAGIDKKNLKKAMDGGPATPFNNITEGKYDVVITTGPAYQTQRQEAAENIIKIAQLAGKTNPADLWHLVSTLDFPGAEEWADTIRKRVPPGMLPEKEDEQPPPPPPPSPEAQIAMAKVQRETERTKVEKIKLQVEIVKLQNELAQNKDGVNQAIIDKLEELMTEHHPADQPPAPGPGNQGGVTA